MALEKTKRSQTTANCACLNRRRIHIGSAKRLEETIERENRRSRTEASRAPDGTGRASEFCDLQASDLYICLRNISIKITVLTRYCHYAGFTQESRADADQRTDYLEMTTQLILKAQLAHLRQGINTQSFQNPQRLKTTAE